MPTQNVSFAAAPTGGSITFGCAGSQITVYANEALASRVVDLLSSAGERAVLGGFASGGLTVILPDLTLSVVGHDLTAAVTDPVVVEMLREGVQGVGEVHRIWMFSPTLAMYPGVLTGTGWSIGPVRVDGHATAADVRDAIVAATGLTPVSVDGGNGGYAVAWGYQSVPLLPVSPLDPNGGSLLDIYGYEMTVSTEVVQPYVPAVAERQRIALPAGVTSGRWYAHARNAPPSLAHDATGEEVAAQILAAYAQAAEGACTVTKDGGVYEVEFTAPGPRGLLDAQSIDLARAVTVTVS